jgi:hypothetical protein
VASELTSRFFAYLMSSPHGGLFFKFLLDPTKTWTISAYLIPIFILFGVCAFVGIFFRAPSYIQFAGFSAVFVLSIAEGHLLSNTTSVFGISVILLTILGFLGLGLGLMSKHFSISLYLPCLGLIGGISLIGWNFALLPDTTHNISTFLITIGIGWAIAVMPAIGFLRNALAMLGRSALILFVGHRFLLQMLAGLFPGFLPMRITYILLLFLTLALVLLLCYVKEHNAGIRTALKRIGA